MLKDFVEQLSVELDIEPKPKMNAQKFIPIQIGDQIEVEIRDLDPGVSFQGKICPVPKNRLETLFLRLMKANFLGQETGASRIGMSSDEKFLTLSMGMPYELSYLRFKDSFEEFVNFIFYWRAVVEKFEKEESLV